MLIHRNSFTLFIDDNQDTLMYQGEVLGQNEELYNENSPYLDQYVLMIKPYLLNFFNDVEDPLKGLDDTYSSFLMRHIFN